jgi:hypothetical protein
VKFRFQIYDVVTGEQWGYPYLYLGRCLNRVIELNIFERANRYSIRPIRSRES